MRRRRNLNCIRFHGFAVRIAPLMTSIGSQELYLKADFLIIGSGVATLRAAIELGGVGNTVLLTKVSATAGNTGYALRRDCRFVGSRGFSAQAFG